MITTVLGKDQAREGANSTWRMAIVMPLLQGILVMAIQYNTAALLGTSDVTNAKTTKTKCGRNHRPQFAIFQLATLSHRDIVRDHDESFQVSHLSFAANMTHSERTEGALTSSDIHYIPRDLCPLHTTMLHVANAGVLALCGIASPSS